MSSAAASNPATTSTPPIARAAGSEPLARPLARRSDAPIDRIEPLEPMDRIEPAEPMDRIEPAEPMDRMDPAEPTEASEPTERAELNDSADPTDAADSADPSERHESTDQAERDDLTPITSTNLTSARRQIAGVARGVALGALEMHGDVRLIADDPAVMSRQDVEQIAGANLDRLAIVHGYRGTAGHDHPDVLDLARRGSRGRADMG
jgi:hypothetical protein